MSDAERTLRRWMDPLIHDLSLDGAAEPPVDSYFLVNVPTVPEEPIEQVDLLLAANGLQEYGRERTGNGGSTVAFVAECFRSFGKQGPAEAADYLSRAAPRANRKETALRTAADAVDLHLEDVVTTRDLWSDQAYWDRVRDRAVGHDPYRPARGDPVDGDLARDGLYRYLRGVTDDLLAGGLGDAMPLRELADSRVIDAEFGVDTHLAEIAEDYRAETGCQARAPELYSLLEIAVAEELEDRHGATVKVGPAEEEMYDRFIRPVLGHDTVQTVQPLGGARQTVPPYTLHDSEPRLCFGDDTGTVDAKIRELDEEFLRVRTHGGKSWHPVVHNAMRLVEARSAMGLPPYEVRVDAGSGPARRYADDPHPEMPEVMPRSYPGGSERMELATSGDVEDYLFSDGVDLDDLRAVVRPLARSVLPRLDPAQEPDALGPYGRPAIGGDGYGP